MRPRGILVGAGLVAAAGALGCAGIWRDAMADLYCQMTVDLELAVPASDPNRAAVETLIDDGWIAAYNREIGFTASVMFSVELDEAMEDGVLHEGEVVRLTDEAAAFRSAAVTPARRAELLLIKAMMDDRARAERGLRTAGNTRTPGPGLTGDAVFERWTLPDDLAAALTRAGWRVAGCEDRVEDDVVWASCDGSQEDLHATATLERYPSPGAAEQAAHGLRWGRRQGSALLEVEVLDESASAGLLHAIAAGAGLDALSDRSLRHRVEAADWRVSGCRTSEEGGGSRTSCDAVSADGAEAAIELARVERSGVAAGSAVDRGVASLELGASLLVVGVHRPEAAEALLAELIR